LSKEISINIMFFSGIDRELNLKEYDFETGIIVNIKSGTRLGNVLKNFGLKKLSRYHYFSNGERITHFTRLKFSREISILKTSGGG